MAEKYRKWLEKHARPMTGERVVITGGNSGIGFAAGVVLAILLDRHVRKRRGISFRITAIEPAA